MKPLLTAQEMARRNNVSAAVHAAYQRRRKLRRLLNAKCRTSLSRRLARYLDDRDWAAAEREARPVHAVGFFLPKQMAGYPASRP